MAPKVARRTRSRSAKRCMRKRPSGASNKQPPEEVATPTADPCPICLDPCPPDSTASWLYECSHCVHRECAKILLLSKIGRRCPMCRARSRGVDCDGKALARKLGEQEDEEEEDEENDEEEEEDEDSDANAGEEEERDDEEEGSQLEQEWLLSSCFRAFGRIYGRTVGARELEWNALRALVNEDLQGLMERSPQIRHMLPWRLRAAINETLFLNLLNGLEFCDGVTRPPFQNVMLLPGGNVVTMPQQPQQPVDQWKIDLLLAAAREVSNPDTSSSSPPPPPAPLD